MSVYEDRDLLGCEFSSSSGRKALVVKRSSHLAQVIGFSYQDL